MKTHSFNNQRLRLVHLAWCAALLSPIANADPAPQALAVPSTLTITGEFTDLGTPAVTQTHVFNIVSPTEFTTEGGITGTYTWIADPENPIMPGIGSGRFSYEWTTGDPMDPLNSSTESGSYELTFDASSSVYQGSWSRTTGLEMLFFQVASDFDPFAPAAATFEYSPGNATTITEILLDDTTLGNSLESGDSVTANGITMTVSNVVATNGGSVADVDGVGILFGADPAYSDTVSLAVTFDRDVRITQYIIGGREDVPSGATLTVSGANGTSAANPIPEFSGSTQTEIDLDFQIGGLPVLKAGQVYTITHNLAELTGGDPIFNLEALIVTPVYISLQPQGGMLQLDYVGVLQEYSIAGGWQDLVPQPANSWTFQASGGTRLFRARK